MTTPGRALDTLIEIAERIGEDEILDEARDLEQRVREGRFFVACVGQFKRGKSSLLNALVGRSVLPVGVVPVTAVVTVLRYGEELRSRVRFRATDWQDVRPDAIGEFVSETENPENEKGVSGVEVYVPCELLRSGMCLVDTPGLGSVFMGNTEATREFVPHIDAALVVLGADPPISGVELDLVAETAKHINRLVLVLSKADKLTEEERQEGRSFAEKVLRHRLGRDVGPVLEISALERIKDGPTRDWPRLEARLLDLTGHELVVEAETRGVRRVVGKLLRRVDEQRLALVRPSEETDRRVATLRATVAEAERSLRDLDYLFKAVQDELAKILDAEREDFLRKETPSAIAALDRRIENEADSGDLPTRGMAAAQEVAGKTVEEWRRTLVPASEALYSKGVSRFMEIANQFLRRAADPSDPALAALPESFEPDLRFRTKAHFHFTDIMTLAAPKLGTRIASLSRAHRVAAVRKNAEEYLTRLLTTNSARVVGDVSDQVLESRRRVQAEVRDHLRAVVRSVETAAMRAAALRAQGEKAIQCEVEALEEVRRSLRTLVSEDAE